MYLPYISPTSPLQLPYISPASPQVRSYMYWSYQDNFEWAEGYRPRFGLCLVTYP